ncbi:MAG: hypothetical protein JW712_04540 [Dehalococcoidales bacterium]|nr:hypothetical protein [Dehalococcoidales bacterium]
MDNTIDFDPWETEPPFELDRIREGVNKDEREHVLHQYVGYLIGKKYSWNNLKAIIIDWNTKNRPPFPDDMLMKMLIKCWKNWSDPWLLDEETDTTEA